MSKAIINRILLIIVLSIWGGVIYKFFYSKGKESAVSDRVINNTFVVKKSSNKNFELFFCERDPFLGKAKIKKKVVEKKQTIKKRKKRKKVTWPAVKYLGTLKKETGEELVLLKVKGAFVKMKKGEKIKEYEFFVYKVYRDSILLKQEAEKRIIKK
ncbi:hypothetical protein [Tenacibaculum sp.]|uniref:hypothetical protein n=1 Tax=Tenacibaculum sp. TaxID=1906242 RepID=UPI003D0BC307